MISRSCLSRLNWFVQKKILATKCLPVASQPIRLNQLSNCPLLPTPRPIGPLARQILLPGCPIVGLPVLIARRIYHVIWSHCSSCFYLGFPIYERSPLSLSVFASQEYQIRLIDATISHCVLLVFHEIPEHLNTYYLNRFWASGWSPTSFL